MRKLTIVFLMGLALSFGSTCKVGADQEQARRVQQKAEVAKQGVQKWSREGKNTSAVRDLMDEVASEARNGNLNAAEAKLDQALAILNGQESPAKQATAAVNSSRNPRLTAEGANATRDIVEGPYRQINIIGDSPKNGYFDPSMEYGPDGTGWMAYSAIFGDAAPFGPNVETHVAKSLDRGKTWTFAAKINTSTAGEFRFPNGTIAKGTWNHEVPTLLYDAGDSGKEWKIFAHRVLFNKKRKKGQPHNALPSSTIIYRHAPHPTGPWSEARHLFSGKALPSEYAKDVQIKLNTLRSDLQKYVIFSELGSVVVDGTIYLSLTALKTDGSDKIILLASNDHAKTWRYIGVLLDRSDASSLGYRSFDGSSLVKIKERLYMFAAPMTRDRGFTSYNGMMVMEFEDISKSKLKRDSKGVVMVEYYVGPNQSIWSGNGGGTADYDEQNTAGGIVFPQMNMSDSPEIFQLFNTSYNIQ